MIFKKKVKEAVDEPNPWLKIEHNHNWLEANAGLEYVCGDCSLRMPAKAELPKVNKVKS